MAKNTGEAAAFARAIVDDPDYRANLKRRAIDGSLSAAVENTLMYYAYGRPKHEVEVNSVGMGDLAHLTAEELEREAAATLERIRLGRLVAQEQRQSGLQDVSVKPLDITRDRIH